MFDGDYLEGVWPCVSLMVTAIHGSSVVASGGQCKRREGEGAGHRLERMAQWERGGKKEENRGKIGKGN